MTNQNGMQIKCRCPECGHVFHVSQDAVADEDRLNRSQLRSEWMSVNGKSYRLTWYDCPSCGLRIFVQGDDWRTEKLLNKCVDVVTRMNDKSTHRFDNERKQSGYLNRLRTDLAESRKRVENELTGKRIVDMHSGNAHEIRFYHGA